MYCKAKLDSNNNLILNSNGQKIITNMLKWPEIDSGFMSPGGFLMGALAGCKIVTFSKVAKYYKVEFSELSVNVDAEVELLDNISDTPFKNQRYKFINIEFTLKTDASLEEIKRLISIAEKFCTVEIAIDKNIERNLKINLI